ncbi:MAG: hypothetical protein E3J35_09305 [Methanomassiliicoccales archaeon]|nr:MAG: hypothetical protein E3J35_09305 [Methanomassiliicoccales archaeon]
MKSIEDSLNLRISPKAWHVQRARWGHPIHTICSYMASFPPKVPHYFIDRFTEEGDIVLDPFCGRGTTPAEACLMGRVGIGSDLNPIAYVLTKAKVQSPTKKSLLNRLSDLESGFRRQDTSSLPRKITMLYRKKTQQQLLYLKNELDYRKSTVDNFIMALVLGGMHGDSGKPSYMSIPMPNTFSMSPNYVRNFIWTHRLKPPKHDAFDVIKHRLKRAYKEKISPTKGKAYQKDVRQVTSIMRGKKADLIFTSPPYLKVIRYGKLNWIRLWMLDIEPSDLDGLLDDKHAVPKYMDFMKETINNLARVLKDDGLCFVVVGQVSGHRGPGQNESVELGNRIRETLRNKVNLEIVGLLNDRYDRHMKVSRIWGKKKMGKATKYDQILILCKDVKAVKKKEFKKKASWRRVSIPYSQTTLQT